MKQTAPVLSNALLRFIRDQQPTEAAFLAWLGNLSREGQFHVLRNAKLIVVQDGIVKLAPDHLSQDGKWFIYGNALYHLESDEVRLVCRDRKNL